MDIFGTQFYPTPKDTVLRMVDGLRLSGRDILDPSAGSGGILDVVKELVKDRYGRVYSNLYAIEKDADLREVLRGKGYNVVGSDLLDFKSWIYFHYILANPPFRYGVMHLLHIWDHISQSGTITKCLLNADNLKRIDTPEKERLVKIIERFGYKEDLGQPFLKGERRTNVQVELVTLTDDREKAWFLRNFDPAISGGESFRLDESEEVELAPADMFMSYEAQFNAGVEAFKEFLAVKQKLIYYMNGVMAKGSVKSSLIEDALKGASVQDQFERFLLNFNMKAWSNVFEKTKLAAVTTGAVKEEIAKLQAQQGKMQFTAANMHDLNDMLRLNQIHIMTQCCLDAFDTMTKYHYKNRESIPGWKTNNAYFVAKKFILDRMGDDHGCNKFPSAGVSWNGKDTLNDIQKAICFISGKDFMKIKNASDLYNRDSHFGERVESEFFVTQLYKKGSMHFWWRDDFIRQSFNALVAKERWGWLPENIKTGVYK